MQSLLQAVGVGARRSLPAAATINWVLKDGLGRLGRLTVATRFGESFDSDLKVGGMGWCGGVAGWRGGWERQKDDCAVARAGQGNSFCVCSLCRQCWCLCLSRRAGWHAPCVQRFRYTTSIIYAASLRWAPQRLCLCWTEPEAGHHPPRVLHPAISCQLHAMAWIC